MERQGISMNKEFYMQGAILVALSRGPEEGMTEEEITEAINQFSMDDELDALRVGKTLETEYGSQN